MKAEPGKSELGRHSRKYAEGELGKERSFVFRGPDDKLNLRAQNLVVFLQMADGVDDATWMFHLERGDYTEWFRGQIKNEELAAEAERVAAEPGMTAEASRAAIREAIDSRYTLPGDAPSGVIDP